MKKINQKTGLAFLLLVFAFIMLTACGDRKYATNSNADVTPAKTAEPEATDENKQEPAEEPDNKKKDETSLTIYSINDESLESEQTTVQVTGEITAEAIVKAVAAAFKEHSLEIGIDSVKQENSNVIVSFLYDKAPLSQVGSTVEETILNSIADSLIDNLPDCKGVIFRAEGEAYESGHYAFGKDELYVKE